MGFWNNYDRTFDLNRDGELNQAEQLFKMEFETGGLDMDDTVGEKDQDDALLETGFDRFDLELMDEDERREALEDAGLDSEDFDFL